MKTLPELEAAAQRAVALIRLLKLLDIKHVPHESMLTEERYLSDIRRWYADMQRDPTIEWYTSGRMALIRPDAKLFPDHFEVYVDVGEEKT